ncbi:phosphopyruvate hydratase [Ancrocorticia sp.]|uniref:phosphopyruvate hydratase n=2 Tax=Ancrocorticia sp. TaxID=2593684 RepID=UPI003F8FA1B9
MPYQIENVQAVETLDSRAKPTLQVAVTLAGGLRATAGVPSGASTGSREAVELRDGDPDRYSGQGVLKAVSNCNTEIRDLLSGRAFDSLAALDQALIDLDGTPNKARLGANAILGTSMAFARAAAIADGKELWQWLPTIEGQAYRLPVPCFNVLNGGVHAPNPLEFQEFMISPLGAPSMPEAVRAGAEVYSALKKILASRGYSTGLGDEGGFAPDLATPQQVCDLLVEAITTAGYSHGRSGIMIALDPASSEFHKDGRYLIGESQLSSEQMIALLDELVERYPIWSIEDGAAEDDLADWQTLTRELGDKVQLVGDDNFCTNPAIISEAIDNGVANAALIKVNQIGTVTEAIDAIRLCHTNGYAQMVSHRSGETPDPFIADFVVAMGSGQIKTGAPARGERIAKYNRLLEITASASLPYGLA